MSIHSKPKVYFFYNGVSPKIENRIKLKSFVEQIFKSEKRVLGSLTYIFCSDKILLRMNQKYLNHNYYTDILTFDLSENEKNIIAEIYISVDRVKENAKNLKTSFKSEICRVIFHGALHLCGYKDKNKDQIILMREKENYYLSRYFKRI